MIQKIFIKIVDKKIICLNFIFLLCGVLRLRLPKEKPLLQAINAELLRTLFINQNKKGVQRY